MISSGPRNFVEDRLDISSRSRGVLLEECFELDVKTRRTDSGACSELVDSSRFSCVNDLKDCRIELKGRVCR